MSALSTQRLPRATAESQGIPASAVHAFINAIESQALGLHSMMLLRHGKVVAEGWWEPYGPEFPHVMFSLSKSFTSTAIGLAAAEGHFSLDDTVVSFFPDDTPANVSANLAAMRIRDLLTMTTGNAEDTTGALADEWVRDFLAQPVEHAPGTHFVYNSGATYMLSAILQKVTGQTLIDYLTPRLLEPLGIVGARWESSPQGINTGGWGLSIKTEDIACFGQLYLQDGIWHGERILPAGWVAEATAKQVNNDGPDRDPAAKDWVEGYGYQFWRCRHGAYRGDGAFGQYCIVMPDQEAVLAMTSGTPNMQLVLDAVWEHLLPAMGDAALPDDAAAQDTLGHTLSSLTLPTQTGAPTSDTASQVTGRTYRIEPNQQQITAIRCDFRNDGTTIVLSTDNDDATIECGYGVWQRCETTLPYRTGRATLTPQPKDKLRVATSGAWSDTATYTAQICLYETPFIRTLTLHFTGDTITIGSNVNVSFGPTQLEELTGTAS